MRDYQRRKTKYILPNAVYHQVLWTIRDYSRLVSEYDSLLGVSAQVIDGMPHAQGGNTDPVFRTAEKREEIGKKIDAITNARERIPKEYRAGVWNNIILGDRFPMDADRSTYGRLKSKFVYEIAEKYLHKGMKIAVTGRIQTGSYTNRDGQKVYTTDVVVEDHEFAESKSAQPEQRWIPCSERLPEIKQH